MSQALETIGGGTSAARRWTLVGALAAVALLVVGVALWLPSSTPQPEAMASFGAHEEEDREVADDADGAVDDDAVEEIPGVTYEVYLSRDPFEPVREPEVEAASADDTITIDDDATDDADGGSPDSSHSGDGTYAECQGGEGEVVCDGRVLTLIDIISDDEGLLAIIQVDTTIYEVREGEIFAEQFRLLRIDAENEIVHFLYGDGDRTDLDVGDSTMK